MRCALMLPTPVVPVKIADSGTEIELRMRVEARYLNPMLRNIMRSFCGLMYVRGGGRWFLRDRGSQIWKCPDSGKGRQQDFRSFLQKRAQKRVHL